MKLNVMERTPDESPSTGSPLLTIRNLKVYFVAQGKKGMVKAVDGIDLSIGRREIVGIVGESGCGKSTLGYSIIRLLAPNAQILEGSISLDGEDILSKNEREMRKIRGRDVSMVFQDPLTSLNPVFKIREQIGRVIRIHEGLEKKEAYKRSRELLDLVELPDPEIVLESYPHQLSGGMQQRIMLAMALALKPKLMIADEPTTAVDATIQAQILRLLRRLNQEVGFSLILITHNLGIVAEICDRAIVMYAGRVVEVSHSDSLFQNPQHPYTKLLLSTLPTINAGIDRQADLPTIAGSVPSLSNPPTGCRFHPRCPYLMEVCRSKEPALINTDLKSEKTKHLTACFLYDQAAKGSDNR